MRSWAAAVLLLPFTLAACAGTPFPPVAERAQAAAAAQAARIATIEASWRAAGGSSLVRPLTLAGQAAISAAWWGFDPVDSSGALQAALDYGAPTVVVPRMPTEWIVSRTLFIRSGTEVLLEAGVVLRAAQGAFRETGEGLIQTNGTHDVSMLGYGAVLEMRKNDYQAPPYEPGEWRHGISLRGVSRGLVAGLAIESSGGDGVYVGTDAHRPCEDLMLRDLDIRDNHRQGISVTSARRLLVEDCLISGSSGTQPMAGIDFEPNSDDPGFRDCVVRGCRIEHNAGPGLLFVFTKLSAASQAVSIRIQGCTIDNLLIAAWLHGLDHHVRGAITFSDCSFAGIAWLRGSSDFSVTFQKTP